MDRRELHGTPNSHGLGDLPDTGVHNGQLMPGQRAQVAAWTIAALVLLCPLFL